MKNSIKTVIAIALVSSLVGCVKVRNPDNDKKPEANVIETKVGDVTVNGLMYISRGEIVTAEEYQQQQESKENDQADFNDVTIKMDRLTLQPGSILYTMGKKVRLQVQDLKSNGGKIATFPERQTAEFGHDGRDGGHIQLIAQLAVGDLVVELRGEKGGEGSRGPNPDITMKGAKGAKATPHLENNNTRCYEGVNGEPGGKGSKGKIGGVGHSGGDSGTLELNIQDASVFDYQVSRLPGAGGQGGAGGYGGLGGEGGEPVHCGKSRGSIGKTGPTGDPGERGPSGPAGQPQTYCVIIQGKMICSN